MGFSLIHPILPPISTPCLGSRAGVIFETCVDSNLNGEWALLRAVGGLAGVAELKRAIAEKTGLPELPSF